jgi:hypothetical protein
MPYRAVANRKASPLASLPNVLHLRARLETGIELQIRILIPPSMRQCLKCIRARIVGTTLHAYSAVPRSIYAAALRGIGKGSLANQRLSTFPNS